MEETVKVIIPVITRYNGPDVNGRIYPTEVVEKAFNEAIKERGSIPICYNVSNCPTESYFSSSVDLSTVIGQVIGKDEDYITRYITAIKNEINAKNDEDVEVLGPVSPYISKENENYKRVILIKYKNSDKIKPYLMESIEKAKKNSRLTIKVNINPFNF